MTDPITIKAPTVQSDVHPLIQKRWSALAFADQAIKEAQMEELFEAASWAASAFNEQPWEYIYAHRGSKGFEELWSCLNPGNQPWTKQAAVLFVALKRNTYTKNGKFNNSAAHDVGMANAHLLLQAVHRDIYGHLMAGFDAEKVKQIFKLNEDLSPVCMGALGYLGNTDDLAENYKKRELSARSRKPVSSFTTRV